MKLDPDTAFAIFQSGAMERHQREDAEDLLLREIVENGMEAGKAGFHLIRPPSDPMWSAAYGRYQPTLDYTWCDVPVYYGNIEYQRILPECVHPLPMYSPSAVLSQARVFANSLCVVSAGPAEGESYVVKGFFSAQSIAALRKLLAPKSAVVNERQSDWYYLDQPVGAPSTPMLVAIASDHKLYLPINIQDLIRSASSSGALAVLANGLTQAQAEDLVARYMAQ